MHPHPRLDHIACVKQVNAGPASNVCTWGVLLYMQVTAKEKKKRKAMVQLTEITMLSCHKSHFFGEKAASEPDLEDVDKVHDRVDVCGAFVSASQNFWRCNHGPHFPHHMRSTLLQFIRAKLQGFAWNEFVLQPETVKCACPIQ